MTTTHTVGFVFSLDYSRILLIEKNRPDWQRGKYNGPGGKVELGETAENCMQRELQEETALLVPDVDWSKFCTLIQGEKCIDCFAVQFLGNETQAITTTDELIQWVRTDVLPENVLPNLRWLISMAKAHLLGQEHCFTTVHYT